MLANGILLCGCSCTRLRKAGLDNGLPPEALYFIFYHNLNLLFFFLSFKIHKSPGDNWRNAGSSTEQHRRSLAVVRCVRCSCKQHGRREACKEVLEGAALGTLCWRASLEGRPEPSMKRGPKKGASACAPLCSHVTSKGKYIIYKDWRAGHVGNSLPNLLPYWPPRTCWSK